MTTHDWILSLFPLPGYFVEAGAHDGMGDSTTVHLERRGWAGVCVEPSRAFRELRRRRKCLVDDRCLWNEDNAVVQFREVRGNAVELSGIESCFRDHWDRSDSVPVLKSAITLTTLLREHRAPPTIEFLSLDTEGSEVEILSAHDFGLYRFLAVVVEHNGVPAQRSIMRGLMDRHGYRVAKETEVEDSYLCNKGVPE